jgi:DNA-binding XRE family transcriptional regulator
MIKNYEKCQYEYDMQLPPGYEELPGGDEDDPELSASRIFQSGRIQLGLSQAELGRIMGIPARSISRIESIRSPTRQQQAFMALLLKLGRHGTHSIRADR